MDKILGETHESDPAKHLHVSGVEFLVVIFLDKFQAFLELRQVSILIKRSSHTPC